jgi:hypothetical protein
MNKSYLTVVLTLTCLLGVSMCARAQETERVRVNVPFEFVAGGATLPAGTYSVGPLSVDAHSGIAILGYSNSAFVLPMAVAGTPAEQPKLSFEHVGARYFLSEIDTPGGAYTFTLPRAMVGLVQVKDQGTGSSSGAD